MLKAIWHSPEDIGLDTQEHGSMALPHLLEVLAMDKHSRILDLGGASGRNVEFLRKLRRSVYVEDLFQNVPMALYEGESSEDVPPIVPKIDVSPAQHRFHVILCWDLLNYLTPAAMTSLAEQLRPLCAPEALLFALMWRRPHIFTRPGRFHLIAEDKILYEPTSPALRTAPEVSKAKFIRMLPGFERYHSFRLRNGMDEELFIVA
jgi:hypothetical protein